MSTAPTLEAERAAPELPPLPKPARRSAAPNFIDLVDYYTAEQVRQAQREARAVGFDEGWQAGRRAPRPPGPAQSALPPKQSIDTPEFRELLQELWMCMGSTKMNKIAAKIIAYIDGRTAASAWISVDDERKPEPKKPVLLFVRTLTRGEDDEGRPHETEGTQVELGEYRANNGNPYFDCYASPMSDNDWITHWMPLPAAPSPQSKQEEAE